MKRLLSILLLVIARVAFGADAKVSDLNSATSVNPQYDVVPFVEYGDKTMSSKGTTKKISAGVLIKGALGIVNVRAAGAAGDGSTDDTDAINAAMASGTDVLFPPGYTFRIDGTVTVPAYEHVRVEGTISGIGNIVCSGSVTIDGGGNFTMSNGPDPRKLQVTSGKIDISRVHFFGTSTDHPYCITVMDHGSASDIQRFHVYDCSAYQCAYFVIRQGVVASSSIANRAMINGNIITSTMNSDAISWDCTPGTDSNVTIEANIIDGVSSTLTTGAGLGIDVSGYSPLPAHMSSTISDVRIVNNSVTHAAQGIHVEYVNRCMISGNSVFDLSVTNTPNISGALSAGILAIGTWNATIQCNVVERIYLDAAPGMGIGVFGGYPVSGESNVPRNTTVSNNTLTDASLYIETQPLTSSDGFNTPYELTDPPILAVEGNVTRNGMCYIKGRGTQTIRNNSFSAKLAKIALAGGFAAKTLFLEPIPYFSDTYASVYRYALICENNNARDEFGTSSFGISTNFDSSSTIQGNAKLIATGNNFGFSTAFNQSNPVNRIHYFTGTNVPFGIEYATGDLLISTTGAAKFFISAGGTSCPGSDTFKVYSTPTLGLIVRGDASSVNLNTSHMFGQRITLGGTTAAVIRRIYYDASAPNGGIVMELVNPTTGAVLDLTAVSNATITATNPLTAVSY